MSRCFVSDINQHSTYFHISLIILVCHAVTLILLFQIMNVIETKNLFYQTGNYVKDSISDLLLQFFRWCIKVGTAKSIIQRLNLPAILASIYSTDQRKILINITTLARLCNLCLIYVYLYFLSCFFEFFLQQQLFLVS